MSVFDFLKRQMPTETKATQAAAPLIHMQGAGRAYWSARDISTMTRSGFTQNPVGFRAVKLIAEAAAALPLVLQDDAARYDTHPILTLLRHPNVMQSKVEFFETLFGQIILTGNGYLELVGDEEVPLRELYVLRADRMTIVPDGNGWPTCYEYRVGRKTLRFETEGGLAKICHIRNFHPQDDHYGLSALQAAAQALDVHSAATRWSKSLLDNAARPSGAIVYRGVDGQSGLSQDQYDRLLLEMESHHQGARNAGRPMLLEGGLDWKPMGFSPSDMEFQKTKEAAAREIAVAIGVPPMMLGIPGEATYANYQEANRAFYRLTVLPLVQKVCGSLSDWFSGHLGEMLELRPDLDQVPALSVERDAQWRRISEASFLTAPEKRALLGLPPLAQEDGQADDE